MLPLARLGWNVALSNAGMRSIYKLNFAVTYRCNSRCLTCGIWGKRRIGEMTLDEIRAFARRNRFSWINLTGGEPFLREDIAEIAAAFSGHSPWLLNLTTNGLLTETIVSKARSMSKLRIPRLMIVVSLDGPPRTHDRVRGIRGSWDRAVETFSALKGIGGVDVFFGHTISRHNDGQFRETFLEARKRLPGLTLKDFHINIAHKSMHYYSNTEADLKPGLGALDEAVAMKRHSHGPLSMMEKKYLTLGRGFIRTGRSPLPCKSLSASVFMGPDGSVYPCTIFGRLLGNVRDTGYNLKPILESAQAKEAAGTAGKSCPQCWTPCEAYQSMLGNAPRLAVKK